jgi:hypothetical protein
MQIGNEEEQMSTTDLAGDAEIPEGLVEAVVHLVDTGPVPLGAYTLAEIDAVSGVVHFLERDPDPALVAEAVRSLAARTLITTKPGSDHVEVRGDLGIALAFQQRGRLALDARITGSEPDTPWRFVLLPQPEGVTLEILIDALGIHFFSLRKTDDAMDRLWKRLPSGDSGPKDAAADPLLDSSAKTALISVSTWQDEGTRQTSDVVLAQEGDVCHVFLRDPENPAKLVAQGLGNDDWRKLVRKLSGVGKAA